MNWIDAKKEKPKGECLLWTSSHIIIIGDWYKGAWRTRNSYWKNGKLKSFYNREDILYWMNLTDVPKPDKYFPNKDKY